MQALTNTTGQHTYHVSDGTEVYEVRGDSPQHAAEQVADGYDLGGQPLTMPVGLEVRDLDGTAIATYDAVADLGARDAGGELRL